MEERKTDLMDLANAKTKITEMVLLIKKMKAKFLMALELRDNKIKNLQRALLNIRTDVKNGKPPRAPTPIKTIEEYQDHYDILLY